MMIAPILTNFTPINTNYRNNVRNTNAIQFQGLKSFTKCLSKDTFEYSGKISSIEKDFNAIKSAIKKENYIGEGMEGKVFQMEDSQYVVKIPIDYFDKKKLDSNKIKENLVEKEVTEQDEVNHIVKKYQNGITIMNRVPGKQIKTKEEMNEVADLPVRAYNKLLNQILDAEKKGMKFDYAMNNVMYDKETGSLTAIDFRPKEHNNIGPLEKMYFVFDCFRQPYEKKVSGKILSAALTNLKSDADPEKVRKNYDFDQIIKLLQHNNPRDWAKIEEINSYITNIKLNRMFAESNYELSNIDNHINYTKSLIKHNLCD